MSCHIRCCQTIYVAADTFVHPQALAYINTAHRASIIRQHLHTYVMWLHGQTCMAAWYVKNLLLSSCFKIGLCIAVSRLSRQSAGAKGTSVAFGWIDVLRELCWQALY